MGAIKGFFGGGGGWGNNNNNNNNPPPRPPGGAGGVLASLGDSNGKSNAKAGDFGKGASPTPTRTMRKG